MAVSSSSKKILIVDDEASIVDLLKDILEAANYQPIGVTKWTDAVDAIGHEDPQLILLDLKMPTVDGPSMLEFIRSEGLDIPVIVVSGFITDKVSEDLSRLGVSAFIQKPFRATDIMAEVERVIGSATETKGSVAASDGGETRMDVLFSLPSDSSSGSAKSRDSGHPGETELLDALKKHDGRPDEKATEPAVTSREGTEDDVLAALRRHNTNTPPSPVPDSKQDPSQPAETRTDDALPADPKADAPPAKESFADPLVGSAKPPQPQTPSRPGAPAMPGATPPSPEPADRPSSHRGGSGHHHRRPPRKRIFTKRNFFLFGGMFLASIVIASFMAVMRWYAAEVDIDELKKKTQESISKQATKELLKELRQQ